MKIEFIKDQQDIRPNRSKIITKGKVLSVTSELGHQYIEMGVAKRVDVTSNEQPKSKRNIPFLTWFTNLNTNNKMVFLFGVLAIPGTVVAVLQLQDRYSQTEKMEMASTHTLPEELEQEQTNEPLILKQDENLEEKDSNVFCIQSYRPLELFDGDVLVTLNRNIEYINQQLELKLVDKLSRKTTISKNKTVGDIIYFNDYNISLLSLEKNISTYDLRIKVEMKKADNIR